MKKLIKFSKIKAIFLGKKSICFYLENLFKIKEEIQETYHIKILALSRYNKKTFNFQIHKILRIMIHGNTQIKINKCEKFFHKDSIYQQKNQKKRINIILNKILHTCLIMINILTRLNIYKNVRIIDKLLEINKFKKKKRGE